MINFKKKRKGFTLLELLISATIFSITVVIGIDLFFNIVDIQKRTAYVQDIQGDARYVMEEIVRQLRQGYLDYAYYVDNGINLALLGDSSDEEKNDNKILVTRDLDNNRFYFARILEGTLIGGGDRYVLKNCSVEVQYDSINKCEDPDNWQTVTPDEVHVENFLIFPTPGADPLALDKNFKYQLNEQPKVTIIFQTETNREETKYQISTSLQTTISTRVYAR